MRLYCSTAVFEGTLLILAWFTAWRTAIQLFPRPRIGLLDAAIGVAWVGLKYLRFWYVKRRPKILARRRVLRHMAPTSRREIAAYVGMVVAAAVAEEAAYRGVFFQLGLHLTSSFWLAGLASALAFGAAHLAQGRQPALIAGVLGFGNQVVVLLTGSLWVAIASHFAYDVLAGLSAARAAPAAGSSPSSG